MKNLNTVYFIVIVLLIICFTQTKADVIDGEVIQGTDSLLIKLNEADKAFIKDKELFKRLQITLEKNVTAVDSWSKEQGGIIKQAKQEFQKLAGEVKKEHAEYKKLSDTISREKKDILSKIDALQSKTNREINKLAKQVDLLDKKISQTRVSIATLTSMTEKNVAGSLDELVEARKNYSDMAEERKIFLGRLQNLISHVRAYSSSTQEDLKALREIACELETVKEDR